LSLVIPPLRDTESVQKLLEDTKMKLENTAMISKLLIDKLGEVSCKTALRLVERSVVDATASQGKYMNTEVAQIASLEEILDDYIGEEAVSNQICNSGV
jgi:hypothetical protein